MDFTLSAGGRGVPHGVPRLARRQPPARARGPGARRVARGRARRRSTQLRAWNRTLADARYAAIAWPEEWGGRGAGVMEQVVYAEEMHRARRAGHAQPARPLEHRPRDHRARHRRAEAHAAPPHAARRRHLVPGLLGTERRLRPRVACARPRCATATSWIVNGQKTWNTLGNMANWCELLVRTDPERAEAQGHHVPARRHDVARASRCGRSSRSPASRSSTRSSSPTCASRSTARSARSTKAGASR